MLLANNNELHYQNRLRISDYRKIHQQASFDIVQETNTTGTAAQIAAIQLEAAFRDYSHEDLIVTASWMVAIPEVQCK
jgi:hypothetical protein